MKKSSRLVVVGDPNQAIYRFRGAGDGDETFSRIANILRNSRHVSERTLPRNYRCDWNVAELTRRWFIPEFEGDSKAVGTVDVIDFKSMMERLNNDGTDIELTDGVDGAPRRLDNVKFGILCRVNVPVVYTAYELIRQKKRVCILGRSDFGSRLTGIIYQLCGKDKSFDRYTDRITDKRDDQGDVVETGLLTRLRLHLRMKLEKLEGDDNEKKRERIEQDIECVRIFAEEARTMSGEDSDSVQDVLREINDLFTDEEKPGYITLSTIHRAKGKEWDVVFILKPDLMPHPAAKTHKEQKQEMNIKYVACTRAKKRLYFVGTWPFDERNPSGILEFEHPPIGGSNFKPQPGVLEDKELYDLEAEYEVMALEQANAEGGHSGRSRKNTFHPGNLPKKSEPSSAPKGQDGWMYPDDGKPF